MINDTLFINKFNSNQLHESKINKLSLEEKKYLENRFTDCFRSYKETIYRIIHHIEILPKCPECGKPVKIRYRYDKLYYHTCGSKECIYKRKGNGPKEVCIEKYGVENQFQRPEIKNKIKNIFLEKYGVEYYFQSEEGKKRISKIASSIKFQEKRNNTLAKNKTWKSSKDEEIIYNELIKYFNVKRQYKSKEYPFLCDFYIVDLDLYIEYNGSDLHNFKPFTNSESDKNELKILIDKSNKIKEQTGKRKTRYDNRIYTWTDLDVRKRNIAKENNLNFKEIWNINEFNLFIKTLIK